MMASFFWGKGWTVTYQMLCSASKSFWEGVWDPKKNRTGDWECVFLCIWLSLKTFFVLVTSQMHVYTYIYIYILHWQNQWTQSISSMLFALCSSALASNQKKQRKNKNTMSQPIMDLHWLVFWICFFFVFLFCFVYVWLGCQSRRAKCRPHWKNDWMFLDVFEISVQHVQNQLKKKNKLMEVHERSAHAYSATRLDIIQVCMFFFSFFWAPSQKVT